MEMKHNVPIQSLIDHIKTALDVDPWAKEMAEELLKEKEPIKPVRDKKVGRIWLCGNCGVLVTESMNYCHKCGKRIEWEGR